ncbi:hypothetical protein [Oceanicola sp. 22II-s10i]|uniref:hypothetical protein n=1 Tax=Oceanicola sp. 22II-s10i TaxID=1317116 RepID=UPI000B520F3F|nr:hypothetical protein [Oceanicola sp. 22II-s10i]
MTERDHTALSEIYDYINGHLPRDQAARIEAEAQADPELAALIAEERARFSQLRHALPAAAAVTAPRPASRTGWRPALAAAVVAFAVGFGVHSLTGPSRQGGGDLDALIQLAAEAHSNSRLRMAMVSQVEHEAMDAAELVQATGIRIPVLPAGWSLKDVQVYPSPYGPSIEIAVTTDDNGLISIFAVRVDENRTMTPVPRDSARMNTAVFQIANTAYVLVGQTAPAPLDDEATEIFRSLL